MRVVVVNETGVRFHTGILKEEDVEPYCSCSKKKSSNRHLEIKGDDDLYITVPDKEYATIVLRKTGTTDRPMRQYNPQGVSIYSTSRFIASVRYFDTHHDAIRHLHRSDNKDERYIVSVKKIEQLDTATEPSNIFMYESSFGDVFAGDTHENYTSNGDQQMFMNLKRSSYSDLDHSYPACWSE